MFMIDYREIGWWYWLITGCLLTAGLAGATQFFLWAIILTAIQIIHYYFREGSVSAFPVQLRIAVLLLLLVSYPEPMRLLYWVPFTGAWARVIFGYCPMARFVSLLPWNRIESFSTRLIRKTFLTPPTRGNILHGLPAEEES